jgi:hypothetical protein
MILDTDFCYAVCCKLGFVIQTSMLGVVMLDVVTLSVLEPFITFSKVLLISKTCLPLLLLFIRQGSCIDIERPK